MKKSHLDYLSRSQPKNNITIIIDDIVDTYIKENPGIVTNYLRNERVMQAQRKQMNARSLLILTFIILHTDTKHGE